MYGFTQCDRNLYYMVYTVQTNFQIAQAQATVY